MSISMFIQLGGVVAYILIAMSIVGVATIVWKYWSIWKFTSKIRVKLPAFIIDKIIKENPDHHILMESIKSEIAMSFRPLYKGLTTIENIASSAPLLGLLGTVIGIFEAFSQIVKAGMDDPAVFADGIRMALVTTVIGLVVAIPHVISFNYLSNQLEIEEDKVENDVLKHLIKHLKEKN